MSEKELKRIRVKDGNTGLTSVHHMAAEATVRRMMAFIREKRRGPEVVEESKEENAEIRRKATSSKNINGRMPSLALLPTTAGPLG